MLINLDVILEAVGECVGFSSREWQIKCVFLELLSALVEGGLEWRENEGSKTSEEALVTVQVRAEGLN